MMTRLLGGSARFRRNFTRLASANILAQVGALAALPILSRVFTPENFAVLAMFTVIHGICLACVTARIDWLVPNARSAYHADRLVAAGVVVLMASVALMSLGIFFGRERLQEVLSVSAGSTVPWLLPVSVLGGGMYLMLQARAIFNGDLLHVSIAKGSQALSTIVLSVLLGFLLVDDNGLVVAYVGGIWLAVITMQRDFRAAIRETLKLGSRRFVRLMGSYGREIVAAVSLSLVNIMFQSVPLLLLAFFYDPVTVGWYGLVFRFATAPIGLITTAMAQSFWAEAADLAKRDVCALRRFYLNSVVRLAITSIPFLIAFLLAPGYIPPLFGREEWSGAGFLLAAVSPYLVGMIVFSPTTHLIVYRRAYWQLAIDLISLCSASFVFTFLAISGKSASAALLGASTCYFVGYLARFAAHLRANKNLLESDINTKIMNRMGR